MRNSNIGWNFPSSNYGLRGGNADPGIESFRGNRYRSLAKEICQNSLDARFNEDKPVRIEFSLNKLDSKDFPKREELISVLEEAKLDWDTRKNESTKKFIDNSLSILKDEKINVLRISDYNTTGLIGAKEEADSNWNNLILTEGQSDKGGMAGGSFGIGKYATFACSEIRTILYSTFDIEGVRASQGVSKLVTYRDKNGDEIQPTGFYGRKERNLPIIGENFNLGYERELVKGNEGTDIYVLGFMEDDNWQDEIIRYILEDYLLSIYLNSLEIQVGDVLITQESLEKHINEYSDIAPEASNYYKVLISEKSKEGSFDFNGMGEVRYKILFEEGLHRKVLMARKNGMKIYDLIRHPAAIKFAGVVMLEGQEINEFFRKLESPQHDKWEADRYSDDPKDRKYADKQIKDLEREIRDLVKKLGKETHLEEIDAIGIGEYLPADRSGGLDSDDIRKENISNKIEDVKVVKRKPKRPRGTKKRDQGKDIKEGLERREGRNDGESNKPGEVKNGSRKDRNIKTRSRRAREVGVNKIRIMHDGERYRIILNSDKYIKEGYIEVKIAGEDIKENIDLSSAYILEGIEKELEVDGNKILLENINKDDTYSIYFKTLDEDIKLALEVSIYEY